jgi:two-component system NtrC family sensor kinase
MKWRQKKVEKRTVLFVDDDEVVLQSLQRGLLDESYNKLFVKSCNEALEILQQVEVHVIVADMRMPEMTGLELLRNVKEDYPDIVGMILSGYEQDAALQTAVDQGEIFKLIPKPWKYGEMDFETLVRRALEHYNLQSKSKPSGRKKREKCKARF